MGQFLSNGSPVSCLNRFGLNFNFYQCWCQGMSFSNRTHLYFLFYLVIDVQGGDDNISGVADDNDD